MARRLEVEIIGDSRHFERSLQRSSKAATRFEASVTGLGRVAVAAGAGFLGAQGVVAGLKASVDAGINLEEQTSKSRQVFAESSAEIEAWGKTTAESFGIANDQALQATGTFGNLFRTVKIGNAPAAEMSKRLVELAADLASFNNASPEDVLDAIRSGLIGEAEPLRRYGVLLSETRVQQNAMAETGKKNAKALTDQEKAFARYRIILEDTIPAQGDFERTSDSAANTQRKLNARLRDTSAELGRKLTPAIVTAEEALIGLIDTGSGERNPFFRFGQTAASIWDKVSQSLGQTATDAELVTQALARIEKQARATQAASLGMAGALQESLALKRELFDLSAGGVADTGGRGVPGGTIEQRNRWFDTRIAREMERVQDIPGRRGQIARMQEIAAQVQARIRATKDATHLANLDDDLRRILRQIKNTRQEIADDAKAAADAAKDAAAEQRRARLETQLGWLEFAVERAQTTKTLKDDMKTLRAVEAYWKERIRQEGRTLELVRELWRTRKRIADLNKSRADSDPLAGLMQVSTRRLTSILAAGTGLGAAGRRVLGANISAQQLRPIFMSVQLDGREVSKSVTQNQSRTGHRTGKQTSGRR